MGDLSKHFDRHEFECSCGCGTDTVDAELILILEEVRLKFGRPITVNSGHRCGGHNASIGGALNSMHLTGKAADIVIKSIDPKLVYEFFDCVYLEKYGLGNYDTFTHIDVRVKKARW